MPTKTRYIAPESPAEPKPEAKGIPVETLDNGQVRVELRDGAKVTFKEPKVRQFILMESWSKDPANKDYLTESGTVVKLAHSCITEVDGEPFTQGFEDWVDNLNIRDMEAVGVALASFQSCFEYLNELNEKAKSTTGTTV
jgi:hypothetical protein